jgi:hypothetical protein
LTQAPVPPGESIADTIRQSIRETGRRCSEFQVSLTGRTLSERLLRPSNCADLTPSGESWLWQFIRFWPHGFSLRSDSSILEGMTPRLGDTESVVLFTELRKRHDRANQRGPNE